MKQSKSCKIEQPKKKKEKQKQQDVLEEMVRRLYMGPDSG